MKGRPGVSGKLFDALGRHNINISAIAQGASERNISCVIDGAQQVRALNAIHQAFFETRKRLALVVVGVGNIGGALLRQLQAAAQLSAVAGIRRPGRRGREQQAISSSSAAASTSARWRERSTRRAERWTPDAFARGHRRASS